MRHIQPKKRTRLRLTLGKAYFTFRRYISWHFGGILYAKERQEALFPCVAFRHETPLIRKLKKVDMWLQYNKVENLKIAVRKLDGLILKPAETTDAGRAPLISFPFA